MLRGGKMVMRCRDKVAGCGRGSARRRGLVTLDLLADSERTARGVCETLRRFGLERDADRGGDGGREVMCDGQTQLCVCVQWAKPWVATVRGWMERPPALALCRASLHVASATGASGTPGGAAAAVDAAVDAAAGATGKDEAVGDSVGWEWAWKRWPQFEMQAELEVTRSAERGDEGEETRGPSQSGELSDCWLRELALAYDTTERRDRWAQDLDAAGLRRVPAPCVDIWRTGGCSSDNPALLIRLLPSSTSALAFHTADMAASLGRMHAHRQSSYPLGRSGISGGQHVVPFVNTSGTSVPSSIEFRLQQASETVLPYFSESNGVLMEGTLEELQSSRVRGGGADGTGRGPTANDCWAEFRATVRRPSGYFKGRGSRTARRR